MVKFLVKFMQPLDTELDQLSILVVYYFTKTIIKKPHQVLVN